MKTPKNKKNKAGAAAKTRTQLIIYSLKTQEKRLKWTTWIQTATAQGLLFLIGIRLEYIWINQCGGGGGRCNELLIIRRVPVKVVGHEENIGSRWDEGMAWFHNLKAQETEGTHQFSWKNDRMVIDTKTCKPILVYYDKKFNQIEMFW